MGSKKREREAAEAAVEAAVEDNDTPNPPSKKTRVETNRSLFVRGLAPSITSSDSLTEFFSQHFPVKHATVVAGRGYGFVTFTDADDCLEAKQKLNNELLGGRRIKLDIAEARNRDTKKGSTVASKAAEQKRQREEALEEARKPPKLIIRNLPWSIKTDKDLSTLFQSFGKVRFADLPQSKGKLSGFGFVTLRGRKNAEKALESLNGTVVDGRTIAVDWAVDKKTWEKGQVENQEPTDAAPESAGDKTSKKKSKLSKKTEADAASKEDGEMNEEDADLANFMKNHMQNMEDEDEDASDSEGGASAGKDDKDDKDDMGDDGDDLEDDEAEAEEEQTPKRTTDNSTTLFIRNLPYTTTDEQLKAHFNQFGAVRYSRVVMDRATDRPAGTGFVCFFNSDDSKACLRNAPVHKPTTTLAKQSVLQDETVDKDGRYTLDGRVLQVAQAVDKAEATRLAELGPGGKKSQDKDKRRLYLLSEGTIPSSSPLFKLLGPAEVKLREQSAIQRKKLIQSNPSLHLSLTRLALRNIPHNVDSKALKALAREAVVGFAKDVKEGRRQPLSKEEIARCRQQDKENEHLRKLKGKGVVRQAKVVFESKEGSKVAEDTGVGKSRGYGFIEYSSHRWALMGLRWLNGHALTNDAGKTLRLIVEFAIENANVVQRRRVLEEKTRERQPGPGGKEGSAQGSRAQPDGKSKDPKKFVKGRRGGKGKEQEEPKAEVEADTKAGRKDAKLAMRTKIIVRKRMVRKKKAAARKGK
ncbi:RNA-binding domain-containing protein [Thozetella sp. PMI_491]|nr:RNA-binding domain-containing protein [Thozetella sp. PMI_491]